MSIEKSLLKKVLSKHNLEYDSAIYVSEIEYDEQNDFYYIYYGDKILPFEKEWLEGNYDYMIPSSVAINNVLTLFAVAYTFQGYKTNAGDYYYEVVGMPDKIKYSINMLTADELLIFQKLIPNSKNLIDELILKENMYWQNFHSIQEIYRKDDNTTDLYLMSQLSDPKYGCSFHQNRVHSKSGKSIGYPTIEQAKIDGYQWPNCRHTMRPFYPDYENVPDDIQWTLYDYSERAKKIKNSEKIRNRQKTLAKIDPLKQKQLYLKKKKEIEEIKKKGYIKEKIY